MSTSKDVKSIGILGFGAFGRLVAEYLHPYFEITVSDPQILPGDHLEHGMHVGSPADVAKADLVILAVPIEVLASSIRELRPHLRPGAIVADVTSVKVEPVKVMKELLPADVEIVGTHPLFGPQSSFDGIVDRKIAICPVRGSSARRIAAFLRYVLKLKVYITTPEEHDKEAAVV
ncbi:MAG: prephenate dehydrogenase, partial [Pseudomonadota bacterium]